MESLRKTSDAGAANVADVRASAAPIGDGCASFRYPEPLISEVSDGVEKDCLTGESEGRPLVEKRGVMVGERSEVEILGGNGNRGPLSFFRRGRRKKVVVVDTVCVVVVVANTP